MITRNLSYDAMRIEDAETRTKLLVKKLYLQGKTREQVLTAVDKLLKKELAEIESLSLRQNAYTSLVQLANREYVALQRLLGVQGLFVALAITQAKKGNLTQATALKSGIAGLQAVEKVDKVYVDRPPMFAPKEGIPLQEYSREYMKKVNRAMTEIAKMNGIDPNDVTGRNSLRNLAEMQTRYESHQKAIDGFKKAGVKLVLCSTHQDCSDRCFPWQGRVYSLDGTSGKTADGREFVPLETAVQGETKRTKSGKAYQWGLLGYNCRHKLYEYKDGMTAPIVSKATQERENKINTKQRNYENQIRQWKNKALFSENREERKYARKKAVELNKEYIAFSHSHGRAYYPARTQLLFERGEENG